MAWSKHLIDTSIFRNAQRMQLCDVMGVCMRCTALPTFEISGDALPVGAVMAASVCKPPGLGQASQPVAGPRSRWYSTRWAFPRANCAWHQSAGSGESSRAEAAVLMASCSWCPGTAPGSYASDGEEASEVIMTMYCKLSLLLHAVKKIWFCLRSRDAVPMTYSTESARNSC